MFVSVSATADYDLSAETFLLLMIEPRLQGETHHVLRESLRTSPVQFAHLDTDGCGNLFRRFLAPRGFFCFDFSAVVETQENAPLSANARETLPQNLPADVLPFTLPSRYCASDKLTAFVGSEFGTRTTGAAKVNAIADWVNTKIRYEYNTTDATTGADEVLIKRAGVCRDFAHLVVSLCRAASVPARYVSGYCAHLEYPDFHAWAQVYLDGAWHNVDATSPNTRRALVPIAHGRDAADVSLLTLWNPARVREQSVTVREISRSEANDDADNETESPATL
ncbi:MAG: transglutaminase family protein [Armatimonadetes bacterium]|nr:transglutaminase family protein [Armatimonadota bacterium]